MQIAQTQGFNGKTAMTVEANDRINFFPAWVYGLVLFACGLVDTLVSDVGVSGWGSAVAPFIAGWVMTEIGANRRRVWLYMAPMMVMGFISVYLLNNLQAAWFGLTVQPLLAYLFYRAALVSGGHVATGKTALVENTTSPTKDVQRYWDYSQPPGWGIDNTGVMFKGNGLTEDVVEVEEVAITVRQLPERLLCPEGLKSEVAYLALQLAGKGIKWAGIVAVALCVVKVLPGGLEWLYAAAAVAMFGAAVACLGREIEETVEEAAGA